ncbi:MAG TPA: rod shape-determining protein RodA [Oscillospiraceae bacterium]|nr:rod shape-determining protein RodA [Oscillospiraceae bacterium]
MFDRRLLRNFDWLLLLTVCAIVAISLLIITSTTINITGDPLYFAKRQLIRFAVGFVAMLFILSIDYTYLHRFAPYIYLTVLALLIAVLFVGSDGGGAQRWIDLGFFELQPSEFAKLGIIISMARLLSAQEGDFEGMASLLPAFFHVALPMGLIFMQPDLGTSLVFTAISFGMLYMAGAKVQHLMTYAGIGLAVGLPALWFTLKDYQKMRLIIFTNPYLDPLNDGYQIIQSLIAVGSGGLVGKGLFAPGTQNALNFLLEQHTDFVFSAYAEATGLLGSVLLVLLYAFLILRIIRLAAQAKDTFGMLVCIGVAIMMTFHILVNIGMTIGIMPVTGIPLPFMSYGGSSLLMNMMAIGVVLNIGMRRQKLMF